VCARWRAQALREPATLAALGTGGGGGGSSWGAVQDAGDGWAAGVRRGGGGGGGGQRLGLRGRAVAVGDPAGHDIHHPPVVLADRLSWLAGWLPPRRCACSAPRRALV
jgi:hypothetical protein